MKIKLSLAAACAAFVAVGAELNTDVYIESHPDYMKLHEKALSLAKRNMEDLGQGWKKQMTCMPGVGIIWQWDSCYMALFAGYTPGNYNGLGNLDNLYTMQGDDGYISMAYTYATRKPTWEGRINPPLYAWCEWLYSRRTGDKSRLARAYDVCSKYFKWLKANRTRPSNGLYYFEDTGSSGMDNSPRSGYFAEHQKGSDVCFVDLSCQQVLHARCLAKIAPLVGKADEVANWTKEADDLAEKINDLMWSERTGFYHDIYIHTNNKLAVKTAAAYWALVSGVATPQRAARLVDHLNDNSTFCCASGVPSLSQDDPNYDERGGYWLGGVWPPIQYMVTRGLLKYGYRVQAYAVAARHLNCMSETMESSSYDGTIWECYAPDESKPSTDKVGALARKDFVGWGGLGPLVMLVEDIIGLDINALEGRIDWHLAEDGKQGVKEFPFNGGQVTALAEVNADTGSFTVKVTTDRPFRLRAISPDGRWRVVKDVKPGTHTYDSQKGNNETDALEE